MWSIGQDEPTPAIRPLVKARFRRVGPEAMPALSVAMGMNTLPSARVEIQKRFTSRRRCYAGWVAGRIASYGWVSFDEEYIGELGLHFHLPPGEAYIWDCATIPAFRQMRLFSALLVFLVVELRAEGVQRIWIGADFGNKASQRGIDRAGFLRVADLLVKQDALSHQMWLEGYPNMPEERIAGMQKMLLRDIQSTGAG